MAKRKIAIYGAALLVCAAFAVWAATPTQAKATSTTTQTTIPLEGYLVYVPCADDDNGEVVSFNGNLHIVDHMTVDAKGTTHIHWTTNAQGLTGIGLTTEDTYVGNGSASQNVKIAADGLPWISNYTDNFGVIGKGKASNFHIKITQRMIVDEDLNTTYYVDKVEESCK